MATTTVKNTVNVPVIGSLRANTELVPDKWFNTTDLAGSGVPCRLEGEVKDLVVFGKIPREIDGTFYRIMTDPFIPPHAGSTPVDGDGMVSAFRFHNGEVDMKTRYVETERYLLERKANKTLFGLYRNPYTHHPCVRSAVDSTANTNILWWNNKLVALKEGALPYELEPDTLATLGYDPWRDQDIKSKTFTAHPKIDPFTNELVTFGYEAKGLGTLDTVAYALDTDGKVKNEFWCKSPYNGFIHDCGITPNWIILMIWPFEGNVERMKRGGHHWAWSYDIPVMWMIVPRHKDSGKPYGWKEGEHRVYKWKNCMPIHTAGAWEENGKLYLESSRVHDNGLPFFPPDDDSRQANPNPKADFVRWEFDPSQPTDSTIPDPLVILDLPGEMPRIDDRFMTKKYEWFFAIVAVPGMGDSRDFIYNKLNGLVLLSHKTGKAQYYHAGEESVCQEPAFIPRSPDAPEGDGYLMTMVDHQGKGESSLVILDTKDITRPIAVVQMPVHLKSQIHGNWVQAEAMGERQPLVREVPDVKISREGALEPML